MGANPIRIVPVPARQALKRVPLAVTLIDATAGRTGLRVAPGNSVVARIHPTPNPLPAGKEGAHRLFPGGDSPALLAGKGSGEGVKAPHFHDHAILACYPRLINAHHILRLIFRGLLITHHIFTLHASRVT